MALPRPDLPLFKTEIPTTKKPISFRPFTGKEEKILLIAKESGSDQDSIQAINQVVGNCFDGYEPRKHPIADTEFLFIQLRMKSVSDVVVITYRFDDEMMEDPETGKLRPLERTFRVNLADVKVHFPEAVDPNIDLGGGVGMSLKWPTAEVHYDASLFDDDNDVSYRLVAKCIDKIWQGDLMFDPSLEKEEDLIEWLEGLDLKTWDHIKRFLASVPYIRYDINYIDSNGDKRVISLTTLSDFFALF